MSFGVESPSHRYFTIVGAQAAIEGFPVGIVGRPPSSMYSWAGYSRHYPLAARPVKSHEGTSRLRIGGESLEVGGEFVAAMFV